jgi:hypothetical protein
MVCVTKVLNQILVLLMSLVSKDLFLLFFKFMSNAVHAVISLNSFLCVLLKCYSRLESGKCM